MELYKLKATCNNNEDTHDFLDIPENFEGVSISTKFNWVPPIGYTPTFSIKTMRIIEEDKDWVDNIFDLYGIGSEIEIEIYKLNALATDHYLIATFLINFESFVKLNYYSEFALKAISCIYDYNKIKDSEIEYSLNSSSNMPNDQAYINSISYQKSLFLKLDSDFTKIVCQLEAIENKMYNDDYAMYGKYLFGEQLVEKIDAYRFSADITTDISFSLSGTIDFGIDSNDTRTVKVRAYKNDFSTVLLSFYEEVIPDGDTLIASINIENTLLKGIEFSDGDVIFLGIEQVGDTINTPITGNLTFNIKVLTEEKPIYYQYSSIDIIGLEVLLNLIFGGSVDYEFFISDYKITNSESIIKNTGKIKITPKNFLSDLCKALGLIINFKNDGTVKIESIESFFSDILDKSNAIRLEYYKDVLINYDNELNYHSILVGFNQPNYDVYTYFENWNKILGFSQDGRNATKNFDLKLTQFRTDFSGILDAFIKKSSGGNIDNNYFIFKKDFTTRASSAGIIHDWLTPRDILENWRSFLSFIFYNYSENTLVNNSKGGTIDNLVIGGVAQCDDFMFSGINPRILPLKIKITGIIDSLDFSEKIIEITHEGQELYIFVTSAKTTDNLNEQKIEGNIIYFAT
jgi:hypothetical protein